MSLFGWSLPSGCTSLPGDDNEAPDHIACRTCAARLPLQPTRSEPLEAWAPYDPAIINPLAVSKNTVRANPETQQQEYLADAGGTDYWDCPQCGTAATTLDAVLVEDIVENFSLLHIPEITNKYPTWAVWEYAADPSDVMDLPDHVADLARQEGLYQNRVWYWLERFHQPSHTTECWTDGFGTTLVYLKTGLCCTIVVNDRTHQNA